MGCDRRVRTCGTCPCTSSQCIGRRCCCRFQQKLLDAEHLCHRAVWAEGGEDKVRQSCRNQRQEEDLVPGEDYRVKEFGGEDWIPYP
eukprot:8950622-Pyramimonas_sp.AAC.1